MRFALTSFLVFFPLKVFALQAGPVLASTCINETSTGTAAWSNPSNAVANDGVYATFSTGVMATISNFLTCSGYAPTIPPSAILDGFQIDVMRYNPAPTPIQITDATVILTLNTSSSTDHSLGGNWPTSIPTFATYGGPTDTWGLNAKPTDIPNLNFKLAADPSPTKDGSVDYAQLTVFFHLPTTIYNGTIRNETLR